MIMQDFIEFISNSTFLTDEHKQILITQITDTVLQKRTMELINNYYQWQEYIKNILKNIEFDKQKELLEFTKDFLIEQEKNESTKNLDLYLEL